MRQDPAPRRLNAAADDTVPGDISTGESVEVGGSRLGTIDNAGDRDFYAVTLVAGVRYTFAAGSVPGSGFPDFRLLLFDADGALLKANDNANRWTQDAAVRFAAPDDGTYFLGVRGKGAGTGAFRVSADADDHGDGIDAATAVPLQHVRRGALETPEDVDAFFVRTSGIGLGPGPVPTIVEVIPEGGGDLSARVTLLGTGSGSQPMAEVPGFGFRFQTLALGDFLITVGFGGGPLPGAGYRVSARLDDSPDDITTDDVLDAGASTDGVIERVGDVDVYRVPLTAGATVRFDGDGQFGPDGGPLDIQLRLRDAEGTLLASDRNSGPGTDARLEFTAAADGDYFLEVAGSAGTTGQYVVLSDLI